ncbi:LPS export ABC transporter permease LptF [Cobetia sp. MB87]|uniref:LPS export ABC transporter permease LptF n=1 Tax=Cobetia sp. MB87 TaxID=2588451 RepID=UPI00140E7FA3|nr:LPS export ABC transporter permease LptF [Cobetia sp. MB87]NHH86843.1 Lipopolysaccharide export system permease protein LptF [Cobetia sp. MB87]
MIIFRYLTREILTTMAAVAGVLMLVIMGSRFIRYFSDAAEGDFPASILGSLMLYHLPGFFELLLPLSFFLAVLLAFGQLYMNSEITVLVACGVGPERLLRVTLLPALLITALVAACSLYLTPAGALKNELLLEQQKQKTDFSILGSGRFQEIGNRTVYAESMSDDNSELENVFIAEAGDSNAASTPDSEPSQSVVRAERAFQEVSPETGSRYLVLSDGTRYGVEPGKAIAQRLGFDRYGVRITEGQDAAALKEDIELATTAQLWASDLPEAKAQLQWRISLPLMVPILMLIGLPLARVNPRQGRFARLLPAIFVHITYLSLLIAAQNAVASEKYPAAIGLWPIHGVYLALGIWLSWRDNRGGGR